MKKLFFLLVVLFPGILSAQIEDHVYELSDSSSILSEKVKNIISRNIDNKQFVFLGESFHRSGADLRKKTDFVKYLVKEEGFENIIFESDFYALYNEHHQSHLYAIWSQAEQCQELFKFLEEHRVSIWGVDNRFHSSYSKKSFPGDLEKFLEIEGIDFSSRYISIVRQILKSEFKANDLIAPEDLLYFDDETEKILTHPNLHKNNFWLQAIKNLKSSSIVYRSKNIKLSIAERDRQMAENLSFFANKYPDKKFIVWAANAHIARTDSEYMGEKTMGVEFLKANPDNSYHIAFASIKMPYRKTKKIERKRKSRKNLLHYLPDIHKDYFMDTKEIRSKYPELAGSPYYAKLWSAGKRHLKTEWLRHFDAIVFIEDGELAEYIPLK
ncbi:erythromycin esterase family protein [Salinimicrobium sp. TH3]|uniref:erythromycin esterase family protein n=1 Tax=Salinimicrobium sp. TH3 TaxID=2997342 RepID=UPI002275F504|nr:erythromycin esterase family protein [Salinimicrobium sp. TH3]MCY2685642.1 erythromycin esterase family protein [Salinimicrobium sp. TH3]